MDRFTTNSFKKQKGLFGILSLFMFLFSSTLVQAQTCNLSSVLTGTGAYNQSGTICGTSITATGNIGDNSLSTYATLNDGFSVSCTKVFSVTGSTMYPAGSNVGVVFKLGGNSVFTQFFGSLANETKLELLNGNSVVQTFEGGTSLVVVTSFILQGLAGTSQSDGAVGGVSTVPFNGWRFTTSSPLSGFTGIQVAGLGVAGGCFQFNNCATNGSAVATSSNGFIANGVAGQTGTLTIPVSVSTAGPVHIEISGGGFSSTQTSTVVNLSSGQNTIVVPVIYDGSGLVGTHAITVTEKDVANTNLVNGTCTINATVKGSFNFNCATSTVTVTPASYVSTGTAQSGSVTLPITNAVGGATVTIGLDNVNGLGNDFQAAFTTTLAAGQTQIVIPAVSLSNFFDGTGINGTRTLTFTSTSAVGNCTASVQVVGPLDVDNNAVTLNLPTPNYTGNTKTDTNPHDGVEITENTGKYNYYAIDCVTQNSTAGNATSTTTVLTSIAGLNPVTGQSYATSLSNDIHGTLVMNRTTGVYSYTKDVAYSGANAKFCVRIEDKNNASPSKVIEYSILLATPLTATASPASIASGASSTLTATGCTSGTVTWTGGASPQTGASVSVSPTATTTYTATCSSGGSATTTVTVTGTGGGGDLAVAFTTNPGASFSQGASKSYVVTVRNVGTTASQATTLSISGSISGFSISGGGSQSIGSLAAGGQQTFSITVSGNNKGSAGALSAVLPSSADSNSSNNSASVPVTVAN